MPSNVADGEAVVAIQAPNEPARVGMVEIERVAPGLFSADSSGKGPASVLVLRVKANGDQVYEETVEYTEKGFIPKPVEPAGPGEAIYLVFFGTGFRHRSDPKGVIVNFGGYELNALYADEAPGYAGLDQVNVLVTDKLAGAGIVDVTLIVDGIKSNSVKVTFK